MSYNALRKGRFSQPGQDYFLTLATHRHRAVFQEFQAARLLIREMRRLETEQRLIWQAWVVMPDHLHGLVSLKQSTLPENIRLLKGRSSRAINAFCRIKGTLWQPAYYDHALRKEENRKAIARYIVANPLRGGAGEISGGLSSLGQHLAGVMCQHSVGLKSDPHNGNVGRTSVRPTPQAGENH